MKTSQQVITKAKSNIAFVKYWGKHGRQYPINPSISMLIPQCETTCEINYELNSTKPGLASFCFENKENDKFKNRIEKYLDSIQDVYPLAKTTKFEIKTSNNFPHSTGIASSASAFAAIAKGLVQLDDSIKTEKEKEEKASILARLASGSACRSTSAADFSIWGNSKFLESNDDFSIPFNLDDKIKEDMGFPLIDTVIVVDKTEKTVSSSQGHALMNTHPYKETRIEQANENLRTLYSALKNGDLKSFGEIIENEALTLHALMMSSYPSFVLIKPNTLKIIELIKNYRIESGLDLYFTLDAGPNLHLIYPYKQKEKIDLFIQQEITPLSKDILWGGN